jgi:hypothetical protein
MNFQQKFMPIVRTFEDNSMVSNLFGHKGFELEECKKEAEKLCNDLITKLGKE